MSERQAKTAPSGGGRVVRIWVRGRLGPSVAAAFTGLEASPFGGCTSLCGELSDQSQLFAHITRVRDLGLQLEGVILAPSPCPRTAIGPTVERSTTHETAPRT